MTHRYFFGGGTISKEKWDRAFGKTIEPTVIICKPCLLDERYSRHMTQEMIDDIIVPRSVIYDVMTGGNKKDVRNE